MNSNIEIRKLYQLDGRPGFDPPKETGKLYEVLLQQGTNSVSVTVDLPTQMGHDGDHDFSEGKVGRYGVTINSLEDMATLFQGINLEEIFVSLNVNATSFILLAFYVALVKRQGNILKNITGEFYTTESNRLIYPPRASTHILKDISEWCKAELPNWNTLSSAGGANRETVGCAFQSADMVEVQNPDSGDTFRKTQIEKLESLKRRRNPARCDSILQGLNDRAAGEENIMPAVIEAAENSCTPGEIADTLREVYGEYRLV